jgi:hypothetical protein
MPMHDWTQVEPTIYHHFHQRWTIAITDALNSGRLPSGYSALIEQHSRGVVPDILTVEKRRPKNRPKPSATATLTPPETRYRFAKQAKASVQRANRVAIRHRLGEVVCVIEIVSPGNKAGQASVRKFIEKTRDFLLAGVSVVLVDPFPPTPRDPQSLHKLLWDEFEETPFEMPADEPLLLASYRATDDPEDFEPQAFVEPFRVGAAMRDMPAWIDPQEYVNVPLEESYQSAWQTCPEDYRYLIEHGHLPEEE